MHRKRKGTSEKVDFHFRCQPKVDTRDGKLLRYLQSDKTELSLREMVLNATSAFWMPYAHKYFNDLSPEELQKSVDRAIYQLQMQIIYLKEDFGSRRTRSRDIGFPPHQLPSGLADPPQMGVETETSNDLSDSGDEASVPVNNSAGEWQDLDF